ncbi:MAG: transglutaminase, partial [Methanobacteriaceae archaeon]|nr:transglutaminase [Methanobacteriaceae archaeon]
MLSISLLNVNYFCAATDEQGLEGETAENLTVNTTNMDTDNLELETTTDSDSEESLNETSENSTNTSTQNNLNETEITDDNTSDHENPQDNNSSVNILNIDDESMLAAGGDSYDNVTGIWMWSSHINSLNVTSLLNSGITDIFLYVNSTNYQTNINSLLEKLQDTGIRVHAWISCFKDSDDNWIDPKNTTHTNNLLNLISDIVSTTDVNGIHLDYVRYSGVGNNAAYKHENGTETITSFVENVYNTVNSIKTKVAVSAALMPEKSVNAYYYGQDYSQLSQFLDFLVPMIYKGNYNEDTDWIASTTEYIVGQANGKPVVAGIQTYRSDSDITKLSADELNQDVNAASDGGSSGYVLFRYGLIDENFWNSVNRSGDDSVSFTIDQIKSAAVWVKAFVEANGKLPDSVTIASKQVSMSQLLQLLTS